MALAPTLLEGGGRAEEEDGSGGRILNGSEAGADIYPEVGQVVAKILAYERGAGTGSLASKVLLVAKAQNGRESIRVARSRTGRRLT